MRILYFGSYDSDYARNRVLIKGLRVQEVDVIECRDNGNNTCHEISTHGRRMKAMPPPSSLTSLRIPKEGVFANSRKAFTF